MKYSELDIEKLNDDQIYSLVMSDVRDYAETPVEKESSPDVLIVLGATPSPMKPRIIKAMQLYKAGYGKYIVLSGGKGWHKLFNIDSKEIEKIRDDEEAQYAYRIKKAKNAKKTGKILRGMLPAEFKRGQRSTVGWYHYMHNKTKRMLTKSEAYIASRIVEACSEIVEIEPDKIFLEEESNDTVTNVKKSMEMMKRVDDIKSVMIVTSCFHCKRAELTFKKYFPDVEVKACPSTIELVNNGRTISKESLMDNSAYYRMQIINELKGIIAYSKSGKIADEEIKGIDSRENNEIIL